MKNLFLAFCCIPILGNAQNFHFSVRAGYANYQGDLKAHSISLKQGRFLGSIGARYDLSEHLAARTYISFTGLRADDSKGTTTMQRRNLSFRTKLLDWEVGAQYNFFSLNDQWWTPYVYLGIGVFHFKPYTLDTSGTKYYLKPLSTEGEGFAAGVKEYKLTQLSIPFGFGAEYALNEDMRVGIEFGYRKIFTDYLDDVSGAYVDQAALQSARGSKAVELAYRGGEVGAGPYPAAGLARGNEKHHDGYYYVAVTYTVRYFFDKYKQIVGIPSGKKEKKVGCPATRY